MKIKAWRRAVLLLLAGIGFTFCGDGVNSQEAADVRLQGAGASFPFPIYSKWFKVYSVAHQNVQIDYQSIGSGAGVKNFIDKTVDFAASDKAMKPKEIARVAAGVQLLPLTAGNIVLAYNVPGITDLRMSRAAYAGIFLGKVKKWNDPAIAKTNPGQKLPDSAINVLVRADASGTTFVFTQHLSAISKEFALNPGTNDMPAWPVGTRSKGNEGVTASIQTTPGSIGYIEFGYAMIQKLPMAQLENKSGNFVAPSTASGQAAIASAEVQDNLIAWVPDPTVKDAYPIATFTWFLSYKKYPDPNKAEVLRNLLMYCLTDGQKESEALGYLPLPDAVAAKVKAAVQNVQ
ncbi:MAG TPA: phosphate ABC transporter substrate-binding protein PstS [Geobacterales bacterium]|nr:phosphate ABC transporter substrate-binding protein PstS [Geobacterales bacterium]